MKLTTLALSLLAAIGAGCAVSPSTNLVATADLPDCFDANYDAQRGFFTLKNAVPDAVNQQCALTVGPRGATGPASRLAAGTYTVSLANGGGGGAGGTQQAGRGLGGGAGGGGAGAKEVQATAHLTEGVYKLTIGAGGPGGSACVFAPYYMGGGPGWAGSPTSIVRIATGEVIAGSAGADSFSRPSRAQHEKSAGKMDGHGGSGPGQTSGGRGGVFENASGVRIEAQSGQDAPTAVASGTGPVRGGNEDRWLAGGGGGPAISGDGTGFVALSSAGFDAPTGRIGRSNSISGTGGIPGGNEDRSSAGGGGGATSVSNGGGGGGESPGHAERPPEHGTLGSGGGGGEGSRFECDPGARGGHGYIALRPN